MNTYPAQVKTTRRGQVFPSETVPEADKVLHIAIRDIHPDPLQARKIFELDKLRELSESIKEFGVLTPLLVRKVGDEYQLIAGERRLRASAMAGFTHVPCILNNADDEKASYMSLIENLQRCDLDYFEEAAGLARLIDSYGLTQEEAARRVGKSQSAVANKLRLLKLSGECVSKIRGAHLSERHARALLRLGSSAAVLEAIEYIAQNRLSVSQTDKYIDRLLNPSCPKPRQVKKGLIRDFRLLINTIQNAVSAANRNGLSAEMEQCERNDAVVLTVTLSKRAPEKRPL
jgi:ParB family chromosome partitioning protein